MMTLRTPSVLILALIGMAGLAGALAQSSSDFWSLTPEQRQALLQEQARQMQQSQEQQRQLQQRIREAAAVKLAAQQQAVAAAQQAQQQQMIAQQQAQQAAQAAAVAASMKAQAETDSENLDKRMSMVESAVDGWRPPAGYSSQRAGSVQLVDPFAPKPAAPTGTAADPLAEKIKGTCLVLDPAHHVVRSGDACPKKDCYATMETGLYPVLPDGSLLDTPERVAEFLKVCAVPGALAFAMRDRGGEQEMVRLDGGTHH